MSALGNEIRINNKYKSDTYPDPPINFVPTREYAAVIQVVPTVQKEVSPLLPTRPPPQPPAENAPPPPPPKTTQSTNRKHK